MQIIHNRLVILLILVYPVFYLGVGGKYPWVLLGEHGRAIGMLVFFGITLSFVIGGFVFKLEKLDHNKIQCVFYYNLLLAILFTLIYDFVQFKHFARFGYQNPWLIYILDGLVLLGAILLKRKLHGKMLLCYLSFFVIAHQLLSIYYFPLATERSDMFAAINVALEAFLNQQSPYAKVLTNVGIPPYLPMTMFSFLPAFLAKIDFRYMALIYMVIFLILIIKKANELSMLSRLAFCLVIVNPYWLMRHDLYFQLFLIEIILILLYFPKFNEFWRIVILGISLATLQFAWIIYPLVILAYSKNFTQLVRQTVLSLLIGIGIVIFFSNGYFKDMYKAFFLHQQYTNPYSSDITFTLATIFYFAKNQYFLYMIQIIGVFMFGIACLYMWFINKNRNAAVYISCGALCYFYFMTTNYFMETYLLLPMLVFLTLSVAKYSNQVKHTQ